MHIYKIDYTMSYNIYCKFIIFITMSDQSPDVENMIKIKNILNRLPQCQQNKQYKNICREIDLYLFSWCNHNFIRDLIDIDPDRSKEIVYCTVCNITQ